MAAQGYQESTLDQGVKSPVGAGWRDAGDAGNREGISKSVTSLRIESNIHAGVKYMRFMMDQYYKDDPMDTLNKGLMTFASYNAGPGRIRQLRAETKKRGLDPNVWFGNVERVASERIGRETVTYVSNIYNVLHHLQAPHRAAGPARGGEGASQEDQMTSSVDALRDLRRGTRRSSPTSTGRCSDGRSTRRPASITGGSTRAPARRRALAAACCSGRSLVRAAGSITSTSRPLDQAVSSESRRSVVRSCDRRPRCRRAAWYAVVADPEGNIFAIWQADPLAMPMPEPEV